MRWHPATSSSSAAPTRAGVAMASRSWCIEAMPISAVVLKSVQLGRDFGDSVEVTAGVSTSDRVIDSPPETLQSGDTVQLAAATSSSASQYAGGHRRQP